MGEASTLHQRLLTPPDLAATVGGLYGTRQERGAVGCCSRASHGPASEAT